MITFNSFYPDIMNTDQVCDYLNISKPQCLFLLNSKKIKGFKINNSRVWKIPKPAIQEYISQSMKNSY